VRREEEEKKRSRMEEEKGKQGKNKATGWEALVDAPPV
jgi:hypothetical protein